MNYLIKIPLLLVSFIPLVVDYKIMFPFSYGKIFYFSLLVLISFLFFTLNFLTNKPFQSQILEKTKYLKNKIFLSIGAFIGISLISTITAFDKYSAFWGNVERGEGFVGLLFLFTFLILLVLNFEKKDWIWFFRLSLITTALMLGKSFIEYADGLTRPNSFIGNPAFLAGYFLYSVASAFIVLKEDVNKWWRYFAVLLLPLSFVGIFLTQTRSAILGVLAGFAVCLVYLFLKGKNIKIKNISLQKISGVLIALGIAFVLIFIVTKNAPLWQKVPGLSRVADISIKDSTTSSRVLAWKVGFNSVNPAGNLKEFLIGWGPDNMYMAFSQNYIFEIYKYDNGFFDRFHNKFLDVFVMSGIFALIAYLLIWFFVFRQIFKNKEFSFENVALLFFFSSFFVHLIFVFDQMPTSLVLYALLGYVIFKYENKTSFFVVSKKEVLNMFLGIVSIILVFVFVRNIWLPYFQMRSYSKNIEGNTILFISENIESVFSPMTIAQKDIRQNFLPLTQKIYENTPLDSSNFFYANQLLDLGIKQGEDYIDKKKNSFEFFTHISNSYTAKNIKTQELFFLKEAENFLREAYVFSPNRPDFRFNLIFNLIFQNKNEEAFNLAKETLDIDPELYDSYYYYAFSMNGIKNYPKKEVLKNFEIIFDKKPDLFQKYYFGNSRVYFDLMIYFYQEKDKENFILASKRLILNNYSGSETIEQILSYVEKDIWPKVDFVR